MYYYIIIKYYQIVSPACEALWAGCNMGSLQDDLGNGMWRPAEQFVAHTTAAAARRRWLLLLIALGFKSPTAGADSSLSMLLHRYCGRKTAHCPRLLPPNSPPNLALLPDLPAQVAEHGDLPSHGLRTPLQEKVG